jgi:erythronate-4-phosphate dehydrogenase
MKIVVDQDLLLARELFAGFGEVVASPGRSLAPIDVRDADVLLVRSVTRVDETLLRHSPVAFVGTATIGVDHVDVGYLQGRGIGFASAPGCNAMSVAEHVCSCLLELSDRHGFGLSNQRVGIVGLGNVGSRLRQRLQAMGLVVLACDPPLAGQGQRGLVDMDAISGCDIVSFHTPLEHAGPHPTFHLANAAFLARLKPGAILVNTSRGAVVDNRALLAALATREDLLTVLDVWEGEPLVDGALLERVTIATPHVAGYSYDGKLRGTWMLYEAFCAFLGQAPAIAAATLLPESVRQVVDLQRLAPTRALDLVRASHRVMDDDAALRRTLVEPDAQRRAAFDRLRRQYPIRREFAAMELVNTETPTGSLPAPQRALAKALGFQLEG